MQSSEKNNFNLSPIKVGFILPAFNEYENIFILLRQIESIFDNKSIIIIDDSTNDNIKNKISSPKRLVTLYVISSINFRLFLIEIFALARNFF